MREQKANDNGFPVVGEQAKEQQIFPFDQLVKYDGATNTITVNANLTINGDTNVSELDIDSGEATKGQVLTADGDSGASWENRVAFLNLESESGDLTDAQIEVAEQDNVIITLDGQFYYKNSQSDESIVFKATTKVVDDDTIVEKVVIDLSDNTYSYSYEVVAAGASFEPTYDDEINDSSTNAVQNKTIYATLDSYAKKDGNYPTLTAGLADNLTPYSEESGDDQDEPFLFQATGTANGTQPDFATESYALMKEKRGNSIVVNQLENGDLEANSSYLQMSYDNSTKTYSCKVLDTGQIYQNGLRSSNIIGSAIEANTNHKFLLMFQSSDNVNFYSQTFNKAFTKNGNVWSLIGSLVGTRGLIGINNAQIDDEFTVSNLIVVDLTQWFDDNIPQDLLDNPSNFFRYYQGDLSYDTGHIENANSRYIKCFGMNQFDGENVVKAIPNATYYINGSATLTYKDVDGNTISSESKSNQTFVVPSNCLSIGVSGSGDISVNLYYEDEPRCLTFEPFEILTNIDTGTETLRSAGSAYDSKAPDGTITRKIGNVVYKGDVSENWNLQSINDYGIANFTIGLVHKLGGSATCNIFTKQITGITDTQDEGYLLSAGNTLYIRIKSSTASTVEAFKTWLSNNNVSFNYELAEYTEEQGTAFSPNLIIDDFGSTEFSGTSGVPQGNLIFYPVDYKAFVDTLYQYTDGTPSNIALKSDLASVDEKIGVKIPECPTTTDGTYVLKATVSDGEVVYNWVLEE